MLHLPIQFKLILFGKKSIYGILLGIAYHPRIKIAEARIKWTPSKFQPIFIVAKKIDVHTHSAMHTEINAISDI